MTDQTKTTEDTKAAALAKAKEAEAKKAEAAKLADEISEIKSRLDLMGVSYEDDASVEVLRAVLKATASTTTPATSIKGSVTNFDEKSKELMRLERFRLSCMNPTKSDVPGEYVTVMNRFVGKVTKFIPFNGKPFHAPVCIVNELKARKFARTRTEGKGVNQRNILEELKEFNIEILPPLTEEELKKLAADQKARGAIDEE